ncbi:Cysteine-tRNA ligase, partial [Smittium mucronatum]
MSAEDLNTGTWTAPVPVVARDGLKIYNSLTKTKVPFVPLNGNVVTWYGCGPTVYDASHLGHARNYITFDYIRRIMINYFGYNVYMVMNITDIDDKIIVRGRQTHLFKKKKHDVTVLDKNLLDEAILAWKEYVSTNFDVELAQNLDPHTNEGIEASKHQIDSFLKLANLEANPKSNMYRDVCIKGLNAISAATKNLEANQTGIEIAHLLLEEMKEIFSVHLDSLLGGTVSDPAVFKQFTQFWESDYMNDMANLNVLRPDLLTRVTEYVPQIVDFVKKIIDNGYAYESLGSVYFNVGAFDGNNGHFYAKLEPKSKGNGTFLEESEGSLGLKLVGKRSNADFALWKASKSGEPAWDSPWGKGRPGWHIECSVMASEVLGKQIDIHSGGIDLAFPHHDNELAQSEAHFENGQWVNYFMHSGHLHIEGSKMSKSLKNFITIKEALKSYSARQLRICFLQQRWDSPSDYKHSSMEEALSIETTIGNFFANTLAIHRKTDLSSTLLFGEKEKELAAFVGEAQNKVHLALCDSFDTPTAIKALVELVNRANVYYRQANVNSDPSSMFMAARYVSKMVEIFGLGSPDSESSKIGWNSGGTVSKSTSAVDNETLVMPYINALSKFRDNVRIVSRQGAIDKKELLKLCDELRDSILPELGILLDDQDEGGALIKLADPNELKAEMAVKRAHEETKRLKKLAIQEANAEKARLRLEAEFISEGNSDFYGDDDVINQVRRVRHEMDASIGFQGVAVASKDIIPSDGKEDREAGIRASFNIKLGVGAGAFDIETNRRHDVLAEEAGDTGQERLAHGLGDDRGHEREVVGVARVLEQVGAV